MMLRIPTRPGRRPHRDGLQPPTWRPRRSCAAASTDRRHRPGRAHHRRHVQAARGSREDQHQRCQEPARRDQRPTRRGHRRPSARSATSCVDYFVPLRAPRVAAAQQQVDRRKINRMLLQLFGGKVRRVTASPACSPGQQHREPRLRTWECFRGSPTTEPIARDHVYRDARRRPAPARSRCSRRGELCREATRRSSWPRSRRGSESSGRRTLCSWSRRRGHGQRLADRHHRVAVMSVDSDQDLQGRRPRASSWSASTSPGSRPRTPSGARGSATASRVTTEHSHPFSTGLDLCLVHDGSLSNHDRLRAELRQRGDRVPDRQRFGGGGGYLTWRLARGDGIERPWRDASPTSMASIPSRSAPPTASRCCATRSPASQP